MTSVIVLLVVTFRIMHNPESQITGLYTCTGHCQKHASPVKSAGVVLAFTINFNSRTKCNKCSLFTVETYLDDKSMMN